MTEIKHSEESELLPEEEYWEQLELLFELYILHRKQERLKKKLIKIQKAIKKNFTTESQQKLKVLQIVIKELVQKREKLNLKILDSLNIFLIKANIGKLNGYILELNKAFKKKKINVNIFQITNEYYHKQLKFHLKNLDKLKFLAKEYILRIKNEEIELNADYQFYRKKLSKNSGYDISNYNKIKTIINQKISFLDNEIIDN